MNTDVDNSATKTKITQTTRVTKQKGSQGFYTKMKNLSTFTFGAIGVISYAIMAPTAVVLLAETMGLTKVAENYLGIEKNVAQTVIVSTGLVGATAAVLESALKAFFNLT